MDAHSNKSEGATNPRIIKRRRGVFPIIGAVALVLILAAILIPHNIESRAARDEANAARSLRELTDLELRHAAAHPSNGFTCDFAQLKAEVPSTGDHTRNGFLFSDPFEGYKFSLTGCEADAGGVVVRYKAAAVPALPGKTGFRAFCPDQTGELRYGVNESPESCRPLPD